MWRETDSWFKVQFADGSFGYDHLDQYGSHTGLFREDGTPIGDEVHVEYTCIDDNAPVPSWYVKPTV